MDSGYHIKVGEKARMAQWVASLGDTAKPVCAITSYTQGWGKLRIARNIIGEPLCLAGKTFQRGYGTHASGQIIHHLSAPGSTFLAEVGLDLNRNSKVSTAVVKFSVWAAGHCLASSPELKLADGAFRLEANLGGATEFVLKCEALGTANLAHADWCDPQVTLADGRVLMLGDRENPPGDTLLPLSFVYGGMGAGDWFRRWGIRRTREAGTSFDTHRFATTDAETGLTCELALHEYHAFPACRWEVTFRNDGREDTRSLETPRSLDLSWLFPGNTKKLYRATGSFDYYEAGEAVSSEAYRDGFMLREDNLVMAPSTLAGTGGRSSVNAMPYFNFAGEGEGLMVGVGWTGQWCANVSAAGDLVRFEAGMERFSSYLRPGERIRLPSILLIAWQGDSPLRGHNLLRRFITDELLPTYDGKSLQAPVSCPTWGGMMAGQHLARIADIGKHKLPYDYYWIDAGWYGTSGPSPDEFSPNWGCQAGDWRIDPQIYPHGMTEISAAAHQAGMKFLLWGEPERAVHGRPVTLEHPEWFLGRMPRAEGDGVIINYGNPEALNWAVETFSRLIRDQDVDCYRQDFNVHPLAFWEAHDGPGRTGMTEAGYVDGLYRFLGELRRRFPNLLIDNCAGGGRRLDFEMMRHSVPLWASDMQCYADCLPERNLQQVQGLAYWLPQFAFGTQFHPGDTYHVRSAMAAGLTFHLSFKDSVKLPPDYPYEWHRERLAEYHRINDFFSGDFYPLLEQSSSFKTWTAYQFDRPDLAAGIALFFRKKDSPFGAGTFQLRGLETDAQYEVEDADLAGKTIRSGSELLADGLPIALGCPASSKLLLYRKI